MTTPLTMTAVLRDGFKLIGRFIRARPWSFGLAVTGALLFAGAIVAAAVVIGRITDEMKSVARTYSPSSSSDKIGGRSPSVPIAASAPATCLPP